MHLLAEILQLVHEIISFLEVLYKSEVIWKTQDSQINTRSSHPKVFCQKIFLKVFPEKNLCWSLFFNKVAVWKPETVRSSHFLKTRTGVSEPAVHRSSTQNKSF